MRSKVTKKVENENFLNMLVCSFGFAFNSFSFLGFLWFRFTFASLPFLVFPFYSIFLFFGNCSKTNCKLRTNWLTEPKAAIKSRG